MRNLHRFLSVLLIVAMLLSSIPAVFAVGAAEDTDQYTIDFDFNIVRDNQGLCFNMQDADNFIMWQVSTFESLNNDGVDKILLRPHFKSGGAWKGYPGQSGYDVQTVDLTAVLGMTGTELEARTEPVHERIVVSGNNIKTYFGLNGETADTPTEDLIFAYDFTYSGATSLPFCGLGFRQNNDGAGKSQEITRIDNLIAKCNTTGEVLYRNDFSGEDPGFAASNGAAVVTEDGWLQVGAAAKVGEQVYTMTEPKPVTFSISGARSVFVSTRDAAYTVSAQNMAGSATVALQLEFSEALSDPVVEGCGNWVIASQKTEGSALAVTLINPNGAYGSEDLMSVSLTAAGQPAIAEIAITAATVSAYQGETEVFEDVSVENASILTRIWRTLYDVNSDGVVDLLDVTRAQRWYGTDHAAADVDSSGSVNIEDLVLILNNMMGAAEQVPTNAFVLYDGAYTAPVLMDAQYQDDVVSARTYEQVARAVGDFRQDVAMVTGAIDDQVIQQLFADSDALQAKRLAAADQRRVPGLLYEVSGGASYENAVIVGVIGESDLVDTIIADGKLSEAEEIRGRWEAYVIKQVSNPVPGVENALVIAGSDARGAIYGLYAISEQIGVSPYYWYSDVSVETQNELKLDYLTAEVNDGPDVKYRGIYINDEEISNVWAKKKFDEKAPGVNYYRRVFELLLRLNANTLWPANHSISTAFYDAVDPNGVLLNGAEAANYGILMASSPSQILLRNNVGEWSPWISANKSNYSSTAFDFTINEAALLDYWRERLEETKDYENILTIGLRGIMDSEFACSDLSKYEGSTDMEKKVNMIIDVLSKQRELIYEVYGTEPQNVPQVFIPYKEMNDMYNAGVNAFFAWDGTKDFNGDGVIDWRDDNRDVILVYAEDNQNYLRQIPTTAEQQRAGGSGVYYHSSYCGAPRSYLVTNDVQLSVMETEMRRAYDTGAGSYWILNVGDIKPGEVALGFFMELAWDTETYDNASIEDKYLYELGQRDFHLSDEEAERFAAAVAEYYQLMGAKKATFFYTDRSVLNPFSKSVDDEVTHEFSVWANSDEGMQFISRINAVMAELDEIYAGLSEADQNAFYEMVYFMADFLRNAAEEHIYFQKNQLAAAQGRFGSAMMYAQLSQTASRRITESIETFDTLNSGKWDNILRLYQNSLVSYEQIDESKFAVAAASEGVGAACENQETTGTGTLRFNSASPADQRYFDVFDCGSSEEGWVAETSADWIVLSQNAGTVTTEQRVLVSVDWTKLTADVAGTITVYNTDENGSKTNSVAEFTVNATVFAGYGDQVGYVAANGYAAMEAEHYTRLVNGTDGSYWTMLDNNAQHEATMKALPSGDHHTEDWASTARIHYSVYFEEAGTYTLALNRLPTLNEGTTTDGTDRTANVAVGVGSAAPTILTGWRVGGEGMTKWRQNILRQYEVLTCQITVQQGWNDIVLYRVDSDIIVDRMVITTAEDAAPDGLYGPWESPNNIPNANTAPITPAALPTGSYIAASVQEAATMETALENVTAAATSDADVVTAQVSGGSLTLVGHRAGTATVEVTFADGSKGAVFVTVTTAADGTGLYNEENGLVIIDAADALAGGKYASSTASDDGLHSWSYADAGVRMMPDISTSWTATTWDALNGAAPSMTYGVMINNPGSYYFYACTTAPDNKADSYHVFVDGNYWFTSNDVVCTQKWHTESGAKTLGEGRHFITVFGREDGVGLHQIALSTSSGLSLAGFQPTSSTVPYVETISMADLTDLEMMLEDGAKEITLQASTESGSEISFQVETDKADVVTAALSGTTLTLTPIREGDAEITVTASAEDCKSVIKDFTVSVSSETVRKAYAPNADGNIVIPAVDALLQKSYASHSNEDLSGRYPTTTFRWVSVQEKNQAGESLQLTPIATSSNKRSWGSVDYLPGVPSVTYTVWVPKAGDYYVSVFSNSPNDATDSFFFGVNEAYRFTSKDVVSNGLDSTGRATGAKWFYYDKVAVSLQAGYNTIQIWGRESGLLLRQIMLSPEKQTGLSGWVSAEAVDYVDPDA